MAGVNPHGGGARVSPRQPCVLPALRGKERAAMRRQAEVVPREVKLSSFAMQGAGVQFFRRLYHAQRTV